MAEFKIGDRVRVIADHWDGVQLGETGTVISANIVFGIKFDCYSPARHDCEGKTPTGYGYYLSKRDIELISEVKPLPEKYVVHTKTQKEADYLFECGVFSPNSLASWCSSCWDTYKEKSAYCVEGDDLEGFASTGFCEKRIDRYGEVIEFEEWLTRIGLKDNKINTKENNDMRFIRDMQVEVTEVYEINKKDNTKDKYMITTVSTPLGKASVKCADKDYNKDEGVHLACAKITAQMSEENMILWNIAMDTWGSMVFESIINRFADKACMGSFDKAYRNYLKVKELEYKKSCICKTCGTKFETPELAREHEKWHVDHKREKYEAYLIRKEAKKRIAEAEREGRIESLMAEIVKKGAENKES